MRPVGVVDSERGLCCRGAGVALGVATRRSSVPEPAT